MNIFFLLVFACDNAKDGTSSSTSVGTTTPEMDTETAVDTGEVEESVVPQFESYISQPITSRLPESYTSCSVIAEQQCVAGKQQVCRVYDSTREEWAVDIPAMTEQAFWFDRYFDLYHQANGLSMDLEFTQPVFAGTPESEWSKPEYFHSYDGRGDASGWTGTALWGAAARYAVTGTAADYERMLGKMESMAFLYEVTSVPGLLARSHFAMLEEGAPAPEGHWNKSVFRFSIGDGTDGHYESQIAPDLHHRLPDYYLEGIEIAGQGGHKRRTLLAKPNQFLWTISILAKAGWLVRLCPHLCGKLYCNILLSSMFKIYDANIIYFHFCIGAAIATTFFYDGTFVQ